jgi:hypothetical protein
MSVCGVLLVLASAGASACFDVDEGPTKGQICKAIVRRDGDVLQYCGTYAGHYPPEFKGVNGYYYECTLKTSKE